MKDFIKLIMGVQDKQSPAPGSPEATLNELKYHHTMGAYFRERLEAHAAKCCEALGIDPTSESIERDWCNEIVYQGTQPEIAVNSIANLRAKDEHKSYADQ